MLPKCGIWVSGRRQYYSSFSVETTPMKAQQPRNTKMSDNHNKEDQNLNNDNKDNNSNDGHSTGRNYDKDNFLVDLFFHSNFLLLFLYWRFHLHIFRCCVVSWFFLVLVSSSLVLNIFLTVLMGILLIRGWAN